MDRKTAAFIAKAKKNGWITFEEMLEEQLRDPKFRKLWEAGAAAHEIRMAIIRKRIEKKLTQAQVAKRAKMQQSAVARFETGESSPTLETASRILAAVGAKVHVS